MKHLGWIGLLLWAVGTVVIRLWGERILLPGAEFRGVLLYLASFVLMALAIPRICQRLKLEKALWFQAATLLTLPTLILDSLSCLFFPRVFPNIDPAAAGVFGGWMLICCGGAVSGVWLRRGAS